MRKILAILLSPLIGAYLATLIEVIYYLSRLNILLLITYSNGDLFLYLGIAYILPLLVQILCIEPAIKFLSKHFKIDFLFYFLSGIFLSFGIGIIAFLLNYWTLDISLLKSFKNAYRIFILFSLYTIFNSIAYNYLFFKQLENK
jgi:hypothetical protein